MTPLPLEIRTAMDNALPPDPLLELAPRDAQLQAARLAQEAFAAAFRLGAEAAAEQRRRDTVQTLARHLRDWVDLSSHEGMLLRRALLLTGLDQWGLAFSQAFGAGALLGVSELIGELRDELGFEDEALCQRFFSRIRSEEAAALDFKIELRRGIHIALWHSMIASTERDEAFELARVLGGLLLGLTREMPELGWRLIADALATVQIQCIAQSLAAEGLARDTTIELFSALSNDLGEATAAQVMAQAAQAVVSWREAQATRRH